MKSLILLMVLLALPFGAFSQPTFKLIPQIIYGLDGEVVTDQPVFTAGPIHEDWFGMWEIIKGERIDMDAWYEMAEAEGGANALLANPHLNAHINTTCLKLIRTLDDCIAVHLSQRDRKLHLLLNPDEERYSNRSMLIDKVESDLRDLNLPLDEYIARWEAEMATLWLQLGIPDLP